MPNEDPLPNMTAQERKVWEELKVSNRGAADLAQNTGRSSVRNLVDSQDRAASERANEGGRERERERTR